MQSRVVEEQQSFKPKILIVDDVLANIMVIEGFLNTLDVEMDRAFSGFEAIEKIKVTEYAMVLLDVQMPELDGFKTAEIIREELGEEHLTIIFISAVYNHNYYYQKGLDTGAVDFITKPLISNVFLGKVKIFLKLYEQRKELEREVEERKKAAESLKESHNAIQTILNNIQVGIYVSDDDTNKIVFANRFGRKKYGKNIIGKSYDKVLNINEGEKDSSSSNDIHTDKEGHFFHLFENSIKWVDGRASKLNVEVDITDKIQAEQEMIRTHKNFVELFNNSPDAVYVESESGVILDANKAACKLNGYNDLRGVPVTDLAPESMKSDILASYKKWFTGEKTFIESKVLRKDKTEIPVELMGKVINFNNERALLVTVRDVSDRAKAHQAILDREQRFRVLFEKIPTVAVYGLNSKKEIIYWNKASENFFGYSKESAIGQKLDQLLVAEGDRSTIAENIKRVLNGENLPPEEIYLLRKDGGILPVSSSYVLLSNSAGEKEVYSIDIDLREKDKVQLLQQSRLQLTEFINQISSGFINITVGEIDATITRAIEAVSSFAEVESSYIYLLDPHGRELTLSHSWSASNSENIEDKIIVDAVDGLNNFIDEVSNKGLEIYPGSTHKNYFPELMETMSINSYVHIPMFVDHLFVGFIGFGTPVHEKSWDDHTIYAFKLIAQITINALERKKADKKLIETHHRSKESDRLKTAFLANMSHEIRTPMNAILGFSSLLSDPDNTGAEQEQFINHITSNGNSLMTLINEILDISKIEAGQIQIKKTTFSLGTLIGEAVTEANKRKKYQGKQSIEIVSNFDNIDSEQSVETDQTRFKQVLTILLDNALKYTKEGRIEINIIKSTEQLIQFQVSDTGIGIPEEMQQIIFDTFRQVEESHTRQYGGTGLGLAIAKYLVNMMGGDIWVESTPEHGSNFFFTLPVSHIEIAESIHIPESSAQINGQKWSDKYIIIAEDVEANFELMEALLKKTGINILWAKDGSEAVKIFTWNKKIDLILMDIQMPVLNGLEATRQIKKVDPDMPVIALTAFTLSENQEKIFDAGCDSFLAKPIKQYELLDMIEKYSEHQNL
jgi:PAS domain S-box-containing protein